MSENTYFNCGSSDQRCQVRVRAKICTAKIFLHEIGAENRTNDVWHKTERGEKNIWMQV